VRKVAQAAVERFGGFDTWVNNAGGSIYGRLLDIAAADHRRLLDTNFWGVVYGSLEAARHLGRRTGKCGGAIINVGSEASDRAIPLQGMYSASKHAVKGFTDALRMELEEARMPIAVTLIKPTAINTPFPEHARTYLDQEPALPPPLYAPDVVAEAILHCAEKPERDVYVGGPAKFHAGLGAHAPRLTDWLMETFYFSKQKSGRPANRADDALHAPTTGLRERGSYRGHVRESSLYTRAALHPVLTTTFAVGAGLAVAALVRALSSNGERREPGAGHLRASSTTSAVETQEPFAPPEGAPVRENQMNTGQDGRLPAPSITRIVLRPLGSPLPLGFFSFAVGTVLLGCRELGWVAPRETTTLAVILLAFVAPLGPFQLYSAFSPAIPERAPDWESFPRVGLQWLSSS
jgi:short-subunit dehydrogenase